MIVGEYEITIYPVSKLYVVVNFDEKKFNKLFHDKTNQPVTKEEIDGYYATTFSGLFDKNETPCVVVVINDTKELHNTIAHEALHVACRILDQAEIYLTASSQEPYAYVVGWAAECMYKTLKRK